MKQTPRKTLFYNDERPLYNGNDKPVQARNIRHLRTNSDFLVHTLSFDQNNSLRPERKRANQNQDMFQKSYDETCDNTERRGPVANSGNLHQNTVSVTRPMGGEDDVKKYTPMKMNLSQQRKMYQGSNELSELTKKNFSDVRLQFSSIRRVHDYMGSPGVHDAITHY